MSDSPTLDDLSSMQRWVAWRTEPRSLEDPKPTKIPYSIGGRAKSDTPATWLTREHATSLAVSRFAGCTVPHGVGIMLGEGPGGMLAGIDLDTCIDPATGEMKPWAREIVHRFRTYTEVSPSGAGAKLFFEITPEIADEIRKIMRTKHGRAWKQSGDAEHPPAIELHISNRYFTVTQQTLNGCPAELRRVPLDDLRWLVEVAGPAINGAAAGKKTSEKGNGNDRSRSAAALRIGAQLRRDGKTFDQMVEAMAADPTTADWVREKGQAAGQRELHRIWDKSAPDLDDDAFEAEIARLACLRPRQYERARGDAANELGLRAPVLDRLVARARGDTDDTKGQGRALHLPTPEPWPEPVNGARLLTSLARFFGRHAVLPPGASTALSLWSVHTHCFEVFAFTPRLQIKAATKNAGKSTVIALLKGVVAKALEVESVSQAFVYRGIELARPTVLMDEADTYLRDDVDLRAMVNAGVKAGGQAGRCVGEDQEPRMFSCHAPVAMAGIGNLHGAIESRAIKMLMKRRTRGETMRPMDDRTFALAAGLLHKAARWARDHAAELHKARPDMGRLLNRDADRWRALYAIADAAGGNWPERARAAQAALAGADTDDSDSLGEQVLSDISEIFKDWIVQHPADTRHEIASAEIVRLLIAMEGRPWADLPGRRPGPLTPAKLARLLAPFKVYPAGTGPERARVNGYSFLAFADAFARHLA